MKSTALWALVILNVLLLGTLLGRSMKPNAAVAQVAAVAKAGDYSIIPFDFPGATVGAVVILDNKSGEMTAIQTNEASHSMASLPRINIADIFARQNGTGGRTATPPGGRAPRR